MLLQYSYHPFTIFKSEYCTDIIILLLAAFQSITVLYQIVLHLQTCFLVIVLRFWVIVALLNKFL